METRCIYSRHGRQTIEQTWMITHKKQLYKIDNHVDTSYDFQSHAQLRVMTKLGTWEIITPIKPTQNTSELCDQAENIIKDYAEYLVNVKHD